MPCYDEPWLLRCNSCRCYDCLTWRGGDAQDVLAVGEHVRCVVLGMEDDFSRISLSTAELEEHDGDMKRDKVRNRVPRLCTAATAAWRRVDTCILGVPAKHGSSAVRLSA